MLRQKRNPDSSGKNTILMSTMLFVACQFTWGAVTNVYSDTTIASGVYDTVNIYDSLDVPPIQTTVDMTGGEIDYCNVYDTAILNFEGGDIFVVISHNNSTVTINNNPSPAVLELYDNSKMYLYNGAAGPFNALIYDNAELHIYGYNLNYDETPSPNWVTGQWENGQDFKIYLRNIYSYDPDQVILHEIPEPATFLLFTFGGLLLRKHRKYLNLKG